MENERLIQNFADAVTKIKGKLHKDMVGQEGVISKVI